MAAVKFSINGQSNTSSLPFAVEVMWNHLQVGKVKQALDVLGMIHPNFKVLARELWEAERRMPDAHPDIPPCPF